jgi:hypothetical protein
MMSFWFLPEDASSQFLSHSPDINVEGSSSNSKAACLKKEKETEMKMKARL